MIQTENLGLEKYELDDAANLADGYNRSMDLIDEFAGTVNGKFPITSAEIEDGTITTADIANGAITTNKIATAAITNDKIATDAIEMENLAADSVTATAIANGAVGTDQLDAASVTGEKIANGAVGTDQLDAASVTGEKIANGAVGISQINESAFATEFIEGSNDIVNSGLMYDKWILINSDIQPMKTDITNLQEATKTNKDNINAVSMFGEYTPINSTLPTVTGLSGNITAMFSPNNNYMKVYGGFNINGVNSVTPVPLSPIPGTDFKGIDTGIVTPFEVTTARVLYGTIIRLIQVGNGIENFRLDQMALGTNRHLYVLAFTVDNYTPTLGQYIRFIIPQTTIVVNANGFTGKIDDINGGEIANA